MGRKRKEKIGTVDKIGEPVDLEKCPVCMEHTDCFSCLEGRCTALKESGGTACVFYKPEEKAMMENKQIYMELREKGRGDLIREHAVVFMALGVLDDEIRDADRTADDLESFRMTDYKKALDEAELKEREEQEYGNRNLHDTGQPSLG